MPPITERGGAVTAAVLPVAGLGTRFLPATKVIPKEMFPVAGRPLVEYAVEEVVAAGIDRVVLVTPPGRCLALEHFAADPALEAALGARGRAEARSGLQALAALGERLEAVEQAEPLGLGHAVGCAVRMLPPGPCAVGLPDDLVVGPVPCLRQLLDVHARLRGTVLAVTEVPASEVGRFGVVDPGRDDGTVIEVRGLVEKPAPGTEPSRLAVVGRYVLAPAVCAALPGLTPGYGGELQLTNAIAQTIGAAPVHAVRISGQRFDCGSPAGLVAAAAAAALRDSKLRAPVAESLQALLSADAGRAASGRAG